MKKIIPFKKEILFNTKLAEVTSISLEHTLHKESNNLITGEFIIMGEYKVTDSSINTDSFDYRLPFDIHLDDKYDLESAQVDIYDFYYEIINNNVMCINIEVEINGVEEKLIEIEEEIKFDNEDVLLNRIETEIPTTEKIYENIKLELEKESIKDKIKEIEEVSLKNKEDNISLEVDKRNDINTIFKTSDESESYSSYKVYIVKENDSIESIMSEYNINREIMEIYNELDEIKIGDKLIIPNYEYKTN